MRIKRLFLKVSEFLLPPLCIALALVAYSFLFNTLIAPVEAGSYKVPSDTPAGTRLVVTSTVISSGIANNAQTSPITTAAQGALILDDYIITCNGTGFAGATNLELSVDNANGASRTAATPFGTILIGDVGANDTLIASRVFGAAAAILTLESGKKVYLHGDDHEGTGAGICTVDLVFTRARNDATISAVNLP